MPYETYILNLDKLLRIEQNIRKSINKNTKPDTLQSNLVTARFLFQEIEKELIERQDEIADTQLFTYIKKARNAIGYIEQTCKSKIVKIPIPHNQNHTNMAFDARLAASILLPFDGDSEKLSSFKDSVKFLKTATEAANHPTLKLFIITRISGKARDALPSDIDDKSIDEIIEQVSKSCESKITSEQVLAKLKTIKKGTAKQQYCEEVESLCSQLSRAYIKEGIPQGIAKKIATKAGVETLIKTVSAENAKIVLQAGSFPTIEQAIQKLNELPDNTESNDVTRVFNVNTNQKRFQNFNQGQQRNWRRGANNNNNTFTRRGPHSYNQRFNYAPRFDNRPHNGNYRGRNDYRGHPPQGRQSHRMYYADAQNAVLASNPTYLQQPQVQSQGHPIWNMSPQQPQQHLNNQTQNQNFLGTMGQYTQSM